jgi:hypothetical protein
MADPSRRFPPPWRAEPIPGGYVVRDANGQALTFSCAAQLTQARLRHFESGGLVFIPARFGSSQRIK